MANITLTITAVDAVDLNSALQDLASLTPAAAKPAPTPTAVGAAPVEEKPKRTRQVAAPVKNEPAAPDESREPDSAAEGSADEGTGDTVPTIEELRATASAVSKSGKQDKVKALLESYGVAAVSKVPEEQRADFLAKLGAL